MMARVVNATIEGLNSKEHLPKYVLVLLDKDLIENLNYFEYGISELLDTCVYWLVKEFNRMFEARREDIHQKKPGALSTATEPRIIWVAMLPRPMVQDEHKLLYTNRSKFNKSLEDTVAKF